MSVIISGDEVRAIALGIRVSKAAANLPQATAATLFNVTGGRVAIVSLIGEVTTAIQNQANNTKLVFDPTATGADTDLCAVLSIANDAVGTLYSLTGTATDAMTEGVLMLASNQVIDNPIVLSEGGIELNCAASNTGQTKWDLIYVPLDDGAAVAAA